MNVDLYERVWMWGVGVILALFFTTTAVAALAHQLRPPSHIETIDPSQVMSDPRFQRQGVSVDESGRVHATLVGLMFTWTPVEFTVPARTPITFHLTSMDVVHGFEIVRTNAQSMVVPGYVSQFTTEFRDPGDYLIACNEYCGVGHHLMATKMRVVSASEWSPPAAAPAGSGATDSSPANGGHANAH